MMIPDLDILYCTMDEKCLGMECCLTIEVLDILAKTFKAYIRFDPEDQSLHMGFEKWNYTLSGAKYFGGVCVVIL